MKKPAAWLASFLFVITGALLLYRVFVLGYPLLPAARGQTWAISMDLYVETGSEGAKVALGLPVEQASPALVAPYLEYTAERRVNGHTPGPLGLHRLPRDQFLRRVLQVVRRHAHPGGNLLDALARVLADVREQRGRHLLQFLGGVPQHFTHARIGQQQPKRLDIGQQYPVHGFFKERPKADLALTQGGFSSAAEDKIL